MRAAAHAVAGVLQDLGLARYVQTTGSRGLHVVVPVRADTDFDTARQFARDVAEVAVADDPAHRTVEVRKEKRGGRVYLDIMRNAYAQTAVAPYSVRARNGAPVATPLEWDGWMHAACGRTDSRFAMFPNGWRAKPIRGSTCPGTPARCPARCGVWRRSVPELPDVEGFRRELAETLPGRRIRRVQVRDAGILRNTTAGTLARRLTGRHFGAPRRHGKWLILPTEGPTLLVHSGMTGRPYFAATGAAKIGHERLVVSLDQGELRYADLRKLRGVWLADDEHDIARVTGPQGPDALSLRLPAFRRALAGRRGGSRRR